jgi:hypothetical protein
MRSNNVWHRERNTLFFPHCGQVNSVAIVSFRSPENELPDCATDKVTVRFCQGIPSWDAPSYTSMFQINDLIQNI